MADFVPQMPSEDEDFDAVIAPKVRKPRTRRAPLKESAPIPQSSAQPVAIMVAEDATASAEQVAEPAYKISPDPAEPAVEASAKVAEFVEPFNQPDTKLPIRQEVEMQPSVEAPLVPASPPPAPEAIKPLKAQKAPHVTRAARTMPSKHVAIEAILLLFVIGLGLWSWQLYSDRKVLRLQVSSLQSDPQATIQKQADNLVSDVSQLMTLPSGETPTIASVSNIDQARQQSAFFNNAQNGDKVLMYVKAGEAILYRPSTNKIILVAPLTFNNSPAASGTVSKP